MKKCIYSIYLIRNLINQKSYVGVTSLPITRRMSGHKNRAKSGDNRPLYRAIRKYGMENFEVELLFSTSDAYTASEIMEPYFIKEMKSSSDDGWGYNLASGGSASFHMSDSVKNKLKSLNIGDKNHMWGKSQKEETRRKIANALIGRKMPEEQRSKLIGRKLSDKHKESLKSLDFSPEHRNKLARKSAKKWTLIDPDGRKFTILDLKNFCNNNGLSYAACYLAARKGSTTGGGWKVYSYEDIP